MRPLRASQSQRRGHPACCGDCQHEFLSTAARRRDFARRQHSPNVHPLRDATHSKRWLRSWHSSAKHALPRPRISRSSRATPIYKLPEGDSRMLPTDLVVREFRWYRLEEQAPDGWRIEVTWEPLADESGQPTGAWSPRSVTIVQADGWPVTSADWSEAPIEEAVAATDPEAAPGTARSRTPLEALRAELGNRVCNMLLREGYETVEDLMAAGDLRLMDVRMLGQDSLDLIRKVLRSWQRRHRGLSRAR